ncbi:hypothetical protein Hamer_G019806 [Homarus americanus]|uniref:Uncharacterized protein n=1 Tax=Homarus americanus TaxID=6706 RepID=A0A8J5JGS1_HOMAM|nr:hypothetical protein Hamer_G019806 [Homarus americanus]
MARTATSLNDLSAYVYSVTAWAGNHVSLRPASDTSPPVNSATTAPSSMLLTVNITSEDVSRSPRLSIANTEDHSETVTARCGVVAEHLHLHPVP